MIIRAKTKRRVTVLIVGVLLLAAAVGGGILYRNRQIAKRYAAMRETGLAAFERGDYPIALTNLGKYLGRYNADADVLFRVAQARQKVPSEDGRQGQHAILFLRRLLELRPDYPQARDMLLRLYSEQRYHSEAIEMAKQMISKSPEYPEAMRAMAKGYTGRNEPKEALPWAERYTAKEPLDLEMQILTLYLLRSAERTQEIIPRAEKLVGAYPGDARFELVLGVAYSVVEFENWTSEQKSRAEALVRSRAAGALAEDRKVDQVMAARVLVSMAAEKLVGSTGPTSAPATQPSLDPRYMTTVVNELDRLGLPAVSVKVLQRMEAGRDQSPMMRWRVAHRFWESEAFTDVDTMLKDLDPSAVNTEAELVALRAMSLAQMNRKAEAEPLAAALAKREGNPAAKAWAAILRQYFLSSGGSPAACIESIQAALQTNRDNPYLLYFLAHSYMALGEYEQAAALSIQASAGRPGWRLPPVQLAELSNHLQRAGNIDLAARTALEAASRAPEEMRTALAVNYAAVAWMKLYTTGAPRDGGEAKNVREIADFVQKAQPGEERTLPAYVWSLASANQKEKAKAAIQEAMKPEAKLQPGTLHQLAMLSRGFGLGVDNLIRARLEQVSGSLQQTPEMVLAKAMELHGKGEDGLKILDDSLKKEQKQDQAFAWRLARARYLDLVGNGEATGAWKTLIEDPSLAANAMVLRQAASARTVQADRDLFKAVIDRIGRLTGENAASWKMLRAQWLLRYGKEAKDKADSVKLLNEAVASIPDSPDAHVLLAMALESTGNIRGAIERLNVAARLQPTPAVVNTSDAARASAEKANSIRLALAQLYQSQSEIQQSREQLNQLKTEALSLEQRQQVARLLQLQGDSAKAMEILVDAADESAEAKLALVQVLRQRKQPQEAEKLLIELLAKPTARVIQVAAGFYASQGRQADAERALAKLDSLELAPGVRDFVLGQYYAEYAGLYGSADRAVGHLESAVKAAPENIQYATTLARIYMGLGRVPDALAVADRAVRVLEEQKLQPPPANHPLQALRAHRQLLTSVAGDRLLLPLAIAVVAAGGDEGAVAAEAIGVLVESKDKDVTTAELVKKLRPLADRAPRLLPLQKLVIQKYLAIREMNDVVAVATQCMRAGTGSAPHAQLAAEAMAEAGNWRQALVVAAQWREFTLDQPLEADAFIAAMYLRLGEPANALRQLEPYRAAAQAQPEKYAQIATIEAQAMIMRREVARAGDLLWPHVVKSPQMRSLWIQMGGMIDDPAVRKSWLERLRPAIPEQAMEEQAMYASAWHGAGHRFRSNELSQMGRSLMNRLMTRPDVTPAVILAHAMMYDNDGEYEQAEQDYRRVLKAIPTHAVAQNNLAMILKRRGTPAALAEALGLAESVVNANPNEATARDTLAVVQIAMGEYKKAVENLRTAVSLQPENLEYRVNLLDALEKARDPKSPNPQAIREVNQLKERIDSMITAAKAVDPEVKSRFEAIKERLR